MTMEKELKDQRIAVMLTPSELKAIDDWSFSKRIRSRGEAIRQLISTGLAGDELFERVRDAHADGTTIPFEDIHDVAVDVQFRPIKGF